MRHAIFRYITLCLTLLALASCNETVDETLRTDYPAPQPYTGGGRHVVWVVLDAANGQAVKQAINQGRAETLRSLLPSSLYSFDGLASTGDDAVTELSGWQVLMSGTNDDERQRRGQSIVSLTRATGQQTVLFATSAEFFHLYGSSADRNEQGDDEAMTAALCQALTQGDAPALSVVELSGVRQAGDEHGFFDEAQNIATPQTIAAIAKADAAIARIIKTLRSRERYTSERWLVAVTSNCGGLTDNSAENVYDRMDRKTFSMLWSDGTQGEML